MKMDKQTIKENLADMSALSQSKTPSAALNYIEELEKELEYWRTDSAAGWDKCEEYRNKLAKAGKLAQRVIEQLRSYGVK